ncbi:hypothetical protein EDM56_01105 [Brevibacillus fluminis]|uniref:Lipoprotein n=1 Tax=Brevibacillus fluminis TaxID=511487 RepID=A0A3M8DXS8_9BACL|nr:hypothetical protein [Brevibacillus fluminis]RNB92329.1 hypothetical protein EDM56_01105 [Brevibacillus fluminis]
MDGKKCSLMTRGVHGFLLACLLSGCSVSEGPLERADGDSLVRSEPYQLYQHVTDVKHVMPLAIEAAIPHMPEQIRDSVSKLGVQNLPFQVGKASAYLVTFTDETSKTPLNQVQLVFLKEKDEYGKYGEEFVAITMTEAKVDPFAGLTVAESGVDLFGNKLLVEKAGKDTQLFHHILQTNGGYVSHYYDYDEAANRVSMTTTSANELDFYAHGYLYQINYVVNGNQVDEAVQRRMVELAKQLLTKKEEEPA